MAENECENITLSKRLEEVELKMDLILNNVNLLVSKLDKKVYQNYALENIKTNFARTIQLRSSTSASL